MKPLNSIFFLALWLPFAGGLKAQNDQESQSPLKVTFAAPYHFQYSQPENRWRTIVGRVPRIDVLITNASTDEIRILDQTSIWGINAVSFTLRDKDGKEWKIVRNFEIHGSQSPDARILPPGESVVYRVNFEDAGWTVLPSKADLEHFQSCDGSGSDVLWTLRATYQGVDCPFEDTLQNWVGTVSSEWTEFRYFPD